MSCLAIIPARSGSKGLKDKNIKDLNGKPLMAYSIEAAKDSNIFSCVHVSTDSEEYAQIAIQNGAVVPFLRSAKLASDDANSWDVVCEVIERYKEVGMNFDVVALLQPTSPLRTAFDIKEAYEIYKKKNANAVISVCELDHSLLLANVLPTDRSMDDFLERDIDYSRQRMDTYYRINGAIYIVDIPYLIEYRNIYQNKSFAYVMPRDRSVDIDSLFDFNLAKFLMMQD